MTMTVSPHVRLFAIAGALAALALGGSFFMLGRSGASEADAVPAYIKPLHPVKKQAHTAAPAKPKPAPHPAKAHPVKAQPVQPHPAKPKAQPAKHAAVAPQKPAPKPKPKPAAKPAPPLPEGLPTLVGKALLAHRVVVVSLYDPQSKVDAMAEAEAAAGARAAGVGFVALNALSEAQAGALTKTLGVLPSPTLLIYRRPGNLVMRLDGFADRDTVAQAADNAS
jgi:outer membrane biosynthesis protein TonB